MIGVIIILLIITFSTVVGYIWLINQRKKNESILIQKTNLISSLQEKLQSLTNKILELSQEKEKLNIEITNLKVTLNNDEHKKELLDTAEKRLHEIEQQILDGKAEIENLTVQRQNLAASQSVSTAEFVTKINGMRANLNRIEEDTLRAQVHLSSLENNKNQLRTDIETIEKDLNDKKVLYRAVLDKYQGLVERWEMVPDKKGERLIEVLGEVGELYPELKQDMAGLEWKKIWLPLVQDLCVREGLANLTGIYKLTLKDNEDICYIGQAVDIKKRWYTHIKKMIGVESKGNEKLYKYRPEDFYWEVIEKDGVNFDHDEQYWIEYYGCKEIGLNKKL